MIVSSDVPRADGTELPKQVWLWLPVVLTIVVLIGYLSLKAVAYERWFESESGFIELATPLVLFFGIGFGVRAMRLRKQLPVWWLAIWIGMVTAGCVYFAGEDLSWGQHLFGWQTPEEIKGLNDQHETNLHNMSSWFDQKPRLLLELWIIIGGIFVAGRRKWKGEIFAVNSWQYWFWPGFACFPAALLAELAKAPQHIKSLLQLQPAFNEIRYSELQELMFAVFLMCYLASNFSRLKKLHK